MTVKTVAVLHFREKLLVDSLLYKYLRNANPLQMV